MKEENSKINTEKILGIISSLVVPYTVPTLVEKYDFFNRLNKIDPSNLENLSKEFNFNKRVFEAILNYLTKEGYLSKDLTNGEYIFSLSEYIKEFILTNSKYNLTDYILLFNKSLPEKMPNSIVSALETGKPAKWDMNDSWEQQMKSGVISETFSKGMMSRGDLLKDYLSLSLTDVLIDRKKLIDIGGSLGDYCGKFTNDFKGLECTVFDVDQVIKRAKENIILKKYERVSTQVGDMFIGDFPAGYDTFLYSNAIHDWNIDQNKLLFKKTFNALDDGGIIIIHDCHLNNDKISPSYAVDHSLFLSIFTSGSYYSYKEIENMLNEAGFNKVEIIETVAGFSAIVGYKN